MTLIAATQTLEPGNIIHLYEITSSAGTFYFSPYNKSDGNPIQMYDYTTNSQLNTYQSFPVIATGFEQKMGGPIARPTITFSLASNVQTGNTNNNFRLAASSEFDSLLGLKITRRTTFSNYLKDGADDTGSGNTPVEFNRQIWIIDRITSFNKVSITYELVSPFDLEGMVLPKRQVVGNACPWVYTGADPTYAESEKVGGCSWRRDGEKIISTYFTNRIYVNKDDEYVISPTVPDSIAAYSGISSGTTVNENTYVSTTSTETRVNADGTQTGSQSVTNYWIAKQTDTKTNLGTPSDSNSKFQRVRAFTAYDASTTYYVYTDTKQNPYVTHTVDGKLRLWQLKKTAVGVAPGFNDNWELGDACGKRLKSCNMRFNAEFVSTSAALQRPKHNHLNKSVLPFGGFPGSQRYN